MLHGMHKGITFLETQKLAIVLPVSAKERDGIINASKTPTPRWISDDSQADQIYMTHRQPDPLVRHNSSADSLDGPGPHIAVCSSLAM
jgi:hypothetical protein